MLIILNSGEEKYFNDKDYKALFYENYMLVVGKENKICYPYSSFQEATLPLLYAEESIETDIKKIR